MVIYRTDFNSMNNTVPNNSSVYSLYLCFLFGFVEDVRQTTFSTILTVKVRGHENSGTALFVRALPSQASDLAIVVDLDQ